MENRIGCDIPTIIVAGFILLICGMEWYSLLLQLVGTFVMVSGIIVWAVIICRK